MTEDMAKQEKVPVVPIPTIDKPKGLSRRAVVGGLAATGVALATGYALTRPQEQPIPAETPKPTEVARPTEQPRTPEPTKTPEPTLSPQQRIELARRLQQEALARGEFKTPLPETVVDLGGIFSDVFVPQTNGTFITVKGLPPEKEVVFPSLVDGTVIEFDRMNRNTTEVKLQMGVHILEFFIPNTNTPLVKKGQHVTLGTPIFSIKYLPNDTVQKGFEQSGVGSAVGIIASIGARTTSDAQSVSKFSIDSNIIKTPDGKPLAIPTISR